MDWETIAVVQGICDWFSDGSPDHKVILDISSAHRCPQHNANEGGSPGSHHVKARAMDFSIRGVTVDEIHDYLITHYPTKYGIGKYKSFIHVDTRSGKAARWSET